MKFGGRHRLLLAAGLAACLCSTQVLAWNAAGHRLSAAIAWEHLSPKAKAKTTHLLQQHPAYFGWLQQTRHYPNQETDFVAFVEAATWADELRQEARSARVRRILEDNPTPDINAYPDWHYENLPLEPGPLSPEGLGERGQLSRQIEQLSEQLADGSQRGREQAEALAWLIHLVGDIHQPLHVVSRMTPEGIGDAGGNLLAVIEPERPRRTPSNLHAYWDNLPGTSTLRGDALASQAQALQREFPDKRKAMGDVHLWREESRSLARDFVYALTDIATPPVVLDEHYRGEAQAIARRRLSQAGYRLARLLNRVLGK